MPTLKTFSCGQTLTVEIHSLSAHGGRGVGRIDGCVVFVPHSAPGDLLEIEVTAVKSRFLEGQISKIIRPGESRRSAPCPVAQSCGGCSWQHINYSCQLLEKEKILKQAIKSIATRDPVQISKLIPSPQEFRYRNRIQLHRHGQRIGYFAAKSHTLVPIVDCLIAEEPLAEELQRLTLNAASPSDNLALQEPMQRIEIARLKNQQVIVRQQISAETPGLFSQVNEAQNKNLIACVLKLLGAQKPRRILDLFCGSGNLTFPAAAAHPNATLIGVEVNGQSIAQAKEHGRSLNSYSQITWQQGHVSVVLRRLRPEPETIIILDPPRAGCTPQDIEQILRLQAQGLIYVSCNPATFTRDVRAMLTDYALVSVQGLDMFPQTEHIELVAWLERRTA